MESTNLQQKLRDELQRGENKESCINDVKKWNVMNQDEVKAHCREWCYKFLLERLANESLASELVGNVVSKLDVSELSAASISLSDKGAADENNDSVNFLALNAESLADKLFAELTTAANSTDLGSIKPTVQYTVSASGHRNRRRTMEDRHVTLPYASKLLNCKAGSSDFGYFGVFDGHGGQEAADYAAVHFHAYLGAHELCGVDNEAALKAAFTTTDHFFCHHARKRSLHSGTTGVCATIEWGKRLNVAWLGDSQALLVRKGGELVPLTQPHKPENEDEKKRIESVGGCVMFFGGWRVNGCLTVSRAIGDVDYKPMISSDAGTVGVDLTGSEEYLVLGCDGLFDSVTSEQIRDAVHKHLEAKGERTTAASALIKLAQEEGSSDNITAVVVFLSNDVAPTTPSSTASSHSDDQQGNGSNHRHDNKKEGGDGSNHSDPSSGGNDPNGSSASGESASQPNDSFPLLPVGKFATISSASVERCGCSAIEREASAAKSDFSQQQQQRETTSSKSNARQEEERRSHRKSPCRRQLEPAVSPESAVRDSGEVPNKWTRSSNDHSVHKLSSRAFPALSPLVVPSNSSINLARNP